MNRRGIVIAHGDREITDALSEGIAIGRNNARGRKRPTDAEYFRTVSDIQRDIIRLQTRERIEAEARAKRERTFTYCVGMAIGIALCALGMVVSLWRYG